MHLITISQHNRGDGTFEEWSGLFGFETAEDTPWASRGQTPLISSKMERNFRSITTFKLERRDQNNSIDEPQLNEVAEEPGLAGAPTDFAVLPTRHSIGKLVGRNHDNLMWSLVI